MKLSRGVSVGAVALAAMTMGVSGAQAWTWATAGAPLLMTGGGGYGTAVQTSFNTGTLKGTYLKDTASNDGRIYVSMYGDLGTHDFKVESGRRADGESSYAKMLDKNFTATSPYGVAQFYYYVNLCRDKPFQPDPCSSATRTHAGL